VTLAHLSGALFEKMAKIELTHVPYRGELPALAANKTRRIVSDLA
jgi:tripartite-type tricarboxylate transporter receptor subunit TctC